MYHVPSLAPWRTSLGRYPLTYGYSLVGRVEEVTSLLHSYVCITFTYIYIYTCICTYVYMCIYIYVHTYIHTYIHI